MANWCFSTTVIFGDKKQLEILKKDFDNSLSNNPKFKKVKTDFGNYWLGNIFLGVGYSLEEVLDYNIIYCRGEICDYHFEEEHINFNYESANRPIYKYIDKMLKEKYPGLKQVTISEEPGFEIFINTDTEGLFFKDKYYLDCCINERYPDFRYFETEKGFVEYFNDFFGTSFNSYKEIDKNLSEISEKYEEDDSFFVQINTFAEAYEE